MRHLILKCLMSLLLTVLGILLPGLAQASDLSFDDTFVQLDNFDIRYYPTSDQLCVTSASIPQDALDLLGTDEPTVHKAMQYDQIELLVLTPQGQQVSLRIVGRPPNIEKTDIFMLTPEEWDLFFQECISEYGFATAEPFPNLPGFAVMSTMNLSDAEVSNELYTFSLVTLYLGKLYFVQTDIFSRSPTQQDIELLQSVAQRLLMLGASSSLEDENDTSMDLDASRSLPAPLAQGVAIIETKAGTLPLQLDELPQTIGTTILPVSGLTSPDAFVRYSVNGISSSRIRADKEGRFSFSMKNLETKTSNEIEVVAYTDEGSATVYFTVQVDWQDTPLLLMQSNGHVEEDTMILSGLTLPNATIQLILPKETKKIRVMEDGSFSCNVFLKKRGQTTFTVRALAPGYRRTETQVSVSRKASETENLASLQKKIKTVSYQKLIENPSRFEGQTVAYEGIVSALSYLGGVPMMVITTSDGDLLAFQCENLHSFFINQPISVIGTLLGTHSSINTLWLNGTFPTVQLQAILP